MEKEKWRKNRIMKSTQILGPSELSWVSLLWVVGLVGFNCAVLDREFSIDSGSKW